MNSIGGQSRDSQALLSERSSKGFGNSWAEVGPESKGHGKLREWQSVVRAHAEQNENYTGVIGVIVGSRIESKVRFRACAFRSDGNVLTPLFTLIEVTIDRSFKNDQLPAIIRNSACRTTI